MASHKNEYSPGVEADRHLLPFKTWEEYLDSLVEVADLRNLRSTATARTIAALGYRTSGDTLSEKEFYDRRAFIHEIVYPSLKPYILVSEGTLSEEPLIQELAARERANRVGLLHTIIFLRHVTRRGFELSGYIDYAHCLVTEDWSPYFRKSKKIWPRTTDLGYYHWRNSTVKSNDSRNFKVVMDPEKGLLFQNRHDHKIICPNPSVQPGSNSTRERIYSSNYKQIELYDHVCRRKS